MFRIILLILMLVFFFVVPLSAEEQPTLTVLDFTVNSISEQDMNSIVSFLSASLFDTGLYRVIDIAQRETILNELEFSNTGCTDESCQLEIGRLLSAEIIVTGDVAKVGSRYVFTARMIETETSETTSTAKAIYQSLDELIDGTAIFAAKLSGQEVPETAVAPAVNDAAEGSAAEESSGKKEKKPIPVRTIAAWSTLGAGAIAAGAGGYFIYNALSYKSSSVDPALEAYNVTGVTDFGDQTIDEYYDSLYSDYLEVFGTFRGKALTGLLTTGAGLVSLGVSAWLFFFAEDKETVEDDSPDMSFMIMPRPDACSFQWRVRL